MPNVSKPIVLVADDEPSMVAMLSSHLRSKGYSVLEASDGDQAWELAHEHLPNLVLLDVMMPGMSGWEVCRKIREAVSLAHTGVIMLTGIGENLNEMTSPLYGADAYLDKPFEFSDLDKKISETIARRAEGALGRADSESEGAKVTKGERTSSGRKAGKGKTESEKIPEMPADKPARDSKKGATPSRPEAKSGPKPALAKAAPRPAPKLDKPMAKTKVKAKPPVKAPAAKSVKTAKPEPKPSKPSKMPMPDGLKNKAAAKPKAKPEAIKSSKASTKAAPAPSQATPKTGKNKNASPPSKPAKAAPAKAGKTAKAPPAVKPNTKSKASAKPAAHGQAPAPAAKMAGKTPPKPALAVAKKPTAKR